MMPGKDIDHPEHPHRRRFAQLANLFIENAFIFIFLLVFNFLKVSFALSFILSYIMIRFIIFELIGTEIVSFINYICLSFILLNYRER